MSDNIDDFLSDLEAGMDAAEWGHQVVAILRAPIDKYWNIIKPGLDTGKDGEEAFREIMAIPLITVGLIALAKAAYLVHSPQPDLSRTIGLSIGSVDEAMKEVWEWPPKEEPDEGK